MWSKPNELTDDTTSHVVSEDGGWSYKNIVCEGEEEKDLHKKGN